MHAFMPPPLLLPSFKLASLYLIVRRPKYRRAGGSMHEKKASVIMQSMSLRYYSDSSSSSDDDGEEFGEGTPAIAIASIRGPTGTSSISMDAAVPTRAPTSRKKTVRSSMRKQIPEDLNGEDSMDATLERKQSAFDGINRKRGMAMRKRLSAVMSTGRMGEIIKEKGLDDTNATPNLTSVRESADGAFNGPF
jgi:hypothetical protein